MQIKFQIGTISIVLPLPHKNNQAQCTQVGFIKSESIFQ